MQCEAASCSYFNGNYIRRNWDDPACMFALFTFKSCFHPDRGELRGNLVLHRENTPETGFCTELMVGSSTSEDSRKNTKKVMKTNFVRKLFVLQTRTKEV